jgi:hypothetical protein
MGWAEEKPITKRLAVACLMIFLTPLIGGIIVSYPEWSKVLFLNPFTQTESTPKAPGNPVAELKTHIDKAISGNPLMKWSNIKYDVKTSDSLVSPYTGIITATFDFLDKADQHVRLEQEFKVILAYSDGQWRINELQAQPGVVTGGTLMTYGWHTFTPDKDGYKAYEAFQTSFGFKPEQPYPPTPAPTPIETEIPYVNPDLPPNPFNG